MVEKLLDKASYSIVRTNPKLTGNVKVTSNGSDIYLESFSANNELSSARFKAFKVSGDSTYDKDVFKFFQRGQTPTDIVYEVFQEFQDIAVLSSYSNQYEMFYSAGTRSVASEAYSEDLGMLAPLWLKDQIPSYFVIFRIDNPAAVNNINAELENKNSQDAQTSKDFTKNNWKGKNVLLFGSEGYGIKAKTLENSDFKFRVNMNENIESLNISNTVSVVCHHIFQSIK